MRKFYKEICLFLLPILIVICFSVGHLVYAYQQINWENEIANQLDINEGIEYDLLLLGSSRAAGIAKNFDFKTENLKVQSLHTTGGGLVFQELYLTEFFRKKNNAQNTIFFIDPFVLYTSKWDKPNFGRPQQFEFSLFKDLIKKMGIQWAYDYLGMYRKLSKLNSKATEKTQDKQLSEIDSNAIKERVRILYGIRGAIDAPKQQKKFLKNLELIKNQPNFENLVFAIPPTLLGEAEFFKNELIELLKKIESEYNIPFYDFSAVYNDPTKYKYFKDHDHLNKEGVTLFFTEYINPLLSKKNLSNLN